MDQVTVRTTARIIIAALLGAIPSLANWGFDTDKADEYAGVAALIIVGAYGAWEVLHAAWRKRSNAAVAVVAEKLSDVHAAAVAARAADTSKSSAVLARDVLEILSKPKVEGS